MPRGEGTLAIFKVIGRAAGTTLLQFRCHEIEVPTCT